VPKVIQNISIGVFGTKGVGKTTFFTTLYHSLVSLPMFTDFECANQESKRYYSKNIKFLEQNEDWETFKKLAGTGQAYDISGTLKRVDRVKYNLIMKDYMGENATSVNLQDDEIDMTKEIRESVYKSDLLICLIDVEAATSKSNGLLKHSAIEDIRNMLRGFLDPEDDIKITIPVAIVLNKVDVILPKLTPPKNVEGLRNWFEKSSGNLIRNLEEDFSNIKTFFYSSKSYHEKWFSNVAASMHQEIAMSHKNGLEVMYDPTGPLLWGIKENEKKEFNSRYKNAQIEYKAKSDKIEAVDHILLEQSNDLESKNAQLQKLLRSIKVGLLKIKELIGTDTSFDEINSQLFKVEISLEDVDSTLAELLTKTSRIESDANRHFGNINQISKDVEATYSKISPFWNIIKSLFGQSDSKIEQNVEFIDNKRYEAVTALSYYDVIILKSIEEEVKKENQSYTFYYKKALKAIKISTIAFASFFSFLVLALFFLNDSPSDKIIPGNTFEIVDLNSPLVGTVNSSNGVIIRTGPSKGFNRKEHPTDKSQIGLGVGPGREVIIIKRTSSTELGDDCSIAAGRNEGYWFYVKDVKYPINEGWVWGNCITIK